MVVLGPRMVAMGASLVVLCSAMFIVVCIGSPCCDGFGLPTVVWVPAMVVAV